MSKKSVDDYLTEGIYGTRLPKDDERKHFLGTLRERIVIVLTIGQVMSDSGIKHLEQAMKNHPNTKLIMNGRVAYRFLKKEKEIANKYNIPHTTISDEHHETDVGAVLTYDYAVNIEDIYVKEPKDETVFKLETKNKSLWDTLKSWF